MEIMKVFSDSYDEERIYSVLMNEEEMILFSEIQKEFGNRGLQDALLGSHVGHTMGLDGTKTVYTNRETSLNGSTLKKQLQDGTWKDKISNPDLHNKILKDRSHPLHEKFAANVRAGRTLRKTGSYANAVKKLVR